jgi:hypothetical protein
MARQNNKVQGKGHRQARVAAAAHSNSSMLTPSPITSLESYSPALSAAIDS